MLRAICLNPVIDRMYYIDGFTAGALHKEIQPHAYAGGKGVNVARVISLLGEECVLYMFAGGGAGETVVQDMRRHGVTLRLFEAEGETRTTINIIDRAGNKETEITEPGPRATPQQTEEFLRVLEDDLQPGDVVICSGIPLQGMGEDIFRHVSGLCTRRGARCVLDVNSVYLKASFPAEYEMAKPNYNELLALNDSALPYTDENLLSLGEAAMAKGAKSLLVSLGGDGGVLMCADGVYKASFPKQDDIVSTIGSGDSTVAGYCVALQRGLAGGEALRLAMACGICNAKFSAVGYIERPMVEQFMDIITVERLR